MSSRCSSSTIHCLLNEATDSSSKTKKRKIQQTYTLKSLSAKSETRDVMCRDYFQPQRRQQSEASDQAPSAESSNVRAADVLKLPSKSLPIQRNSGFHPRPLHHLRATKIVAESCTPLPARGQRLGLATHPRAALGEVGAWKRLASTMRVHLSVVREHGRHKSSGGLSVGSSNSHAPRAVRLHQEIWCSVMALAFFLEQKTLQFCTLEELLELMFFSQRATRLITSSAALRPGLTEPSRRRSRASST